MKADVNTSVHSPDQHLVGRLVLKGPTGSFSSSVYGRVKNSAIVVLSVQLARDDISNKRAFQLALSAEIVRNHGSEIEWLLWRVHFLPAQLVVNLQTNALTDNKGTTHRGLCRDRRTSALTVVELPGRFLKWRDWRLCRPVGQCSQKSMRRVCSVITTVALLLSLTLSRPSPLGAQPLQGNSSDALVQARAAMKRGDISTAESLLEQTIQQDQTSAEAYFLLGVVYLKLGQTNQAEPQLLKAVDLRPNYPEAFSNLGVLYDQQGRFDKSVPAFVQALKLNPTDGNAAYDLGLSYLRQKKPEEALGVFTQLLERLPSYSRGYLQSAVAQFDLRHYAEAEKLLRKYTEISPEDGNGYLKLGEVLYNEAKFREAFAAFQMAAKLNPKMSRVYSQLGYAYYSREKFPEAKVALERAIALDQGNVDANLYMGMMLADSGDRQNALTYLRRVVDLQPDNAVAIYYEGYIALLDGNLPDALALLQDAVRRKPDEVRAYYALALTLRRLKRMTESEEALKKFHELQAAQAEQGNGAVYLTPAATSMHDSTVHP